MISKQNVAQLQEALSPQNPEVDPTEQIDELNNSAIPRN